MYELGLIGLYIFSVVGIYTFLNAFVDWIFEREKLKTASREKFIREYNQKKGIV